jgi:hypothetical protein
MSAGIMTNKKRQAIHAFVNMKLSAAQDFTVAAAVKWTLYAERLHQDTLYAALERKGYRWLTRRQVWTK